MEQLVPTERRRWVRPVVSARQEQRGSMVHSILVPRERSALRARPRSALLAVWARRVPKEPPVQRALKVRWVRPGPHSVLLAVSVSAS